MKFNLDSIIIFTQDIYKLRSFYSDILKLSVIEEINSEWILYNAGNCNLGIHKAGKDFLNSGQNTNGTENNIKIVFETSEDIIKIREYLVKAGTKVKNIKSFENYGYMICDGEDPEGNVFQIRQRKQI